MKLRKLLARGRGTSGAPLDPSLTLLCIDKDPNICYWLAKIYLQMLTNVEYASDNFWKFSIKYEIIKVALYSVNHGLVCDQTLRNLGIFDH